MANDVLDREVRFLDVCSDFAGDAYGNICEIPQTAAIACQDEGLDPKRTGGFDSVNDISRSAAGADPEKHVAWLAQSLDLACEDPLEIEVVRVGGQERSVGRERQCGQRWTNEIAGEPAGEFGRKMLAIGGTASVPAQQQLATGLKGPGNQL